MILIKSVNIRNDASVTIKSWTRCFVSSFKNELKTSRRAAAAAMRWTRLYILKYEK